MAMIADLRLWNDSVKAWDIQEYSKALGYLHKIRQQSSKTLYNIGCCLQANTQLDEAIKYFSAAIDKDEHMAIAYFQRGNTHFKQKKWPYALTDYEKCVDKFRGRKVIDYNQLGLKYKLYICEPLHNAGCVQATMGGGGTQALELLLQAQRTQAEQRHQSIQQSITTVQSGKVPNLLQLPDDVIFRPAKSKMANISKKDYLGKAKVVSTVDDDKTAGFEAPKKLESGLLTVEEIKQKSSSAPSSPVLGRKRLPAPPPSASQLLEVHNHLQGNGGSTQNISAGSKSVLGNLILSITSSQTDAAMNNDRILKHSSSDTAIHRSSMSRQSKMVRERTSEKSASKEDVVAPPRPSLPFRLSPGSSLQDIRNNKPLVPQAKQSYPQTSQTSNSKPNEIPSRGSLPPPPNKPLPPPPNKPLPPRPQPHKMDPKPQIRSKQETKPEIHNNHEASTTNIFNNSRPVLHSKPLKPFLSNKPEHIGARLPIPREKPNYETKSEEGVSEFQAMRARLKKVAH